MLVVVLGLNGEAAGGPPRQAAHPGGGLHLGEVAEGRRPEVDRRLPGLGGRRPGRGEELLGGADQVRGRLRTRSGSQTRTCVPRATRSVSSCMSPGTSTGISDSMPSTAMPSASLPRISSSSGARRPGRRPARAPPASSSPGTGAPRAGRAARRGSAGRPRRSSAARRPRRPRTRRGPGAARWGEDVEQATADGELAALLDELHAGVRGVDERTGDVVEVRVVARLELDRDEVAEARRQRLQHAADRGDQDVDRAVVAGVVRSRGTASRRPTVSARGLSRSWAASPRRGRSPPAGRGGSSGRSAVASASCSPAVTTRTGTPAPGFSAASAAATMAERAAGR